VSGYWSNYNRITALANDTIKYLNHERIKLRRYCQRKSKPGTSKIAWKELQRFFACGAAVFVAPTLDLVDVAYQFSIDNNDQCCTNGCKTTRSPLVSDQQAINWLESDILEVCGGGC